MLHIRNTFSLRTSYILIISYYLAMLPLVISEKSMIFSCIMGRFLGNGSTSLNSKLFGKSIAEARIHKIRQIVDMKKGSLPFFIFGCAFYFLVHLKENSWNQLQIKFVINFQNGRVVLYLWHVDLLLFNLWLQALYCILLLCTNGPCLFFAK